DARELARDGEPEASSAEAPRRRCIDLHKFLEQFALLFGGHPDAGVSDSEIDPVAAVSQHPARTQCHLTLLGEFAGIAEQIEQDCRSRIGSTVSAPRFFWVSTTSRFWFCSASWRAVSTASSISGVPAFADQ